MDIIELDRMRKAFAPPEERYKNPRAEARKLRYLWTFDKPINQRRDTVESRILHKEAAKKLENKEMDDARLIIKKGLYLEPRSAEFFALRGDICMQLGQWSKAVRNYEIARQLSRAGKQDKLGYVKQLCQAYAERGNWHGQRGDLFRAASDYEQTIILGSRYIPTIETQDKLLETLQALGRYEAYHLYWQKFIKSADPSRTSALLTYLARWKVKLREVAPARHMLFEALDLDKGNAKAQQLLQSIYDLGHSMAAYAVIWCMHGCYNKALRTIEKCRECDPYNPGYTLLKSIALRLSGRIGEAAKWLKSVDKGFYKLLEPSRDKRGSVMGTLTVHQTRKQLVKQWYLIRYDAALKCVSEGRDEEASRIIAQIAHVKELGPHPHLLLGDSLLYRGQVDQALRAYTRAREKQAPKEHPELNRRLAAILKPNTHDKKKNEGVVAPVDSQGIV